jgi:hypothetical protein
MSSTVSLSSTGSSRQRPSQPHAVIQTHGLNGPRKRELRAQTKSENEVILQRIEASEPYYRQTEFVRDRYQTLLYLQNISKFPKRFVSELEITKRETLVDSSFELIERSFSMRPSTAPACARSSQTNMSIEEKPFQQVSMSLENMKMPTPPSYAPVKVPKKWEPKGNLIPRVAYIRPKSSAKSSKEASIQANKQTRPRTASNLVPRVAYISKKSFVPVEPPKPAKVPINYDAEFSHPEEYIGDEELFITTDEIVLNSNSNHQVENTADKSVFIVDGNRMKSIMTGIPAFTKSFHQTQSYSMSIKVFVSSILEESLVERNMFIEQHVLNVSLLFISFYLT